MAESAPTPPPDLPSSSPSTSPTSIHLRVPTTSGISPPAPLTTSIPSPSFLSGTWHVTHSTLPMWRKARNVAITYNPLPSASDAAPKLDDQVTYQELRGDTIKSVRGIDTPAGDGAWDWRGRGWLMIASSHWEVLGFGPSDASESGRGQEGGGEAWVVTFFAKTIFTPAGIDIYSRRKEGLSEGMLEAVKRALAESEAPELKKLAEALFEVRRD